MIRAMAAKPAPAGAPPAPPEAPGHSSVDAAAREQAGLAYVAVASFLASRVAPFGGFALALAGGTALARAAARGGLRTGCGTTLAALVQSVAIMGPSRINTPLTQALSAPLLGWMEARRRGFAAQTAVCLLIRLAHVSALYVFFIWIVLGGLDAYAGGYDIFWSWVPGLPSGVAGALIFTAAGIVAWALAVSPFQVFLYRRALRRWPEEGSGVEVPAGDRAPGRGEAEAPAAGVESTERVGARRTPRFDPRAVALAAAVAFTVLLASTEPVVLAGVAGWLVLAWLTARGDRTFLLGGLVLALLLATGALGGGLLAGLGAEETLRRTARAGLLVLVATWLRSAAGERGLREVAHRSLGRLRRVPSAGQAAEVLDWLGGVRGLGAAAGRLRDGLLGVRRRPGPLAGAILRWIAAEQTRFAPAAAPPQRGLRLRAPDAALVALAVATTATLPFAGP